MSIDDSDSDTKDKTSRTKSDKVSHKKTDKTAEYSDDNSTSKKKTDKQKKSTKSVTFKPVTLHHGGTRQRGLSREANSLNMKAANAPKIIPNTRSQSRDKNNII